MTETTSPYTKQAEDFLEKYGLQLTIKRGPKECPPWQEPGKHCQHGLHYRVSLWSPIVGPETLAFDFWGSQHDAGLGKAPSAYDVLACLGSDSSMLDDPDEVLEEFGPMKIKQALACVEHGRKVRTFCRQGHILLDDLQAIA